MIIAFSSFSRGTINSLTSGDLLAAFSTVILNSANSSFSFNLAMWSSSQFAEVAGTLGCLLGMITSVNYLYINYIYGLHHRHFTALVCGLRYTQPAKTAAFTCLPAQRQYPRPQSLPPSPVLPGERSTLELLER